MAVALKCECGYVAQSDDDDSMVALVKAHAFAVHRVRLAPDVILKLAHQSCSDRELGVARTRGSGEEW